MAYSNYIVYADESGDHSLGSINPEYPVFVLSFCIFEKEHYRTCIMPALTRLKFEHFGHDMVVLHELDIRKRLGFFARMNKEGRVGFVEGLGQVIQHADFTLVAVVIDKKKLCDRYNRPPNPYHVAMTLGLERVYWFLNEKNEGYLTTFVVFEARGKKEDTELELEFRRVCDGANGCGTRLPLDIVFASKQVNSTGLQNRAFDLVRNKFRQDAGEIDEAGLKVYP
jgi:hypothetical protein